MEDAANFPGLVFYFFLGYDYANKLLGVSRSICR